MKNNSSIKYLQLMIVLFFIGCNYNISPNKVKTCLSQDNIDKGLYKVFWYGPPLKYTENVLFPQEVYDSKLDSILEYIHIHDSTGKNSVYYEWYGTNTTINEINFSVLKFKDGLFYHEDTLYNGSVFYSNYDVKEKYCCDNCTPLEDLIKKDFIVENGIKRQ